MILPSSTPPSRYVGLIRCLLELPADEPRFASLAALAVLVGREPMKSDGAGKWLSEEIQLLHAEVRRLEVAWSSFLRASGPQQVEQALRAAGHHIVFREMEEAVRGGALIPCYDELLVRVAQKLLGGYFNSTSEVREAVVLLSVRATPEKMDDTGTSKAFFVGPARALDGEGPMPSVVLPDIGPRAPSCC
eukprot:gnl/TRDRNA2_/TRDRNA2_194690_c0_seq1.p1 gnl/TRDRNA2_/TRDRNA2_194690_c0~~gnl/TRDRNA2_/TRDRNA2_194690_c0_seq1.p1  ORF type:complete len:190 (+),score=15.18 gnl/TRDRNA2_/TRDRNA2_194690_c0_seq1:71-640(+)